MAKRVKDLHLGAEVQSTASRLEYYRENETGSGQSAQSLAPLVSTSQLRPHVGGLLPTLKTLGNLSKVRNKDSSVLA